MMEDELIRIWQSSVNEEQIKFQKSRLIMDVQSNLDRFDRAVKYRDLTEIVGAILMIPLFTYQVYAIPFPLSKIASALIVIWLAYVIYRLRQAREYKPTPLTETYIDYLHKSREYLQIQKRLSDTVTYWYILPSISASLLFIIGGYLGGRIGTQTFIIIIIGAIVLGIGLYLWTMWLLKKYLLPKLEKLDELIEVMEE